MVRFNVFEGSRRVALLIKVLWVIFVVAVNWGPPNVSIPFTTYWYRWPPSGGYPIVEFKKGGECRFKTDAIEYRSKSIDDGKIVSVELCFKALRADSGEQVVPYKVDGNGSWWGNTPYMPEVTAYTGARADAFELSEADRKAAQREWRSQQVKDVGLGLASAVGGWIALSLLQMLIGWIVRGFFGIAGGQDRRPNAPAAWLSR